MTKPTLSSQKTQFEENWGKILVYVSACTLIKLQTMFQLSSET